MGAAGVQLSAEEVARLEQEVPADQVVGTRNPGAQAGVARLAGHGW